MSNIPPMRERLTRENLHGVWAAIATPFDDDDRFDILAQATDMTTTHERY